MARDAIQATVDRLAERLQRSVVINDASVHLLYASAHYGDEDPVRIRAVLQREADSKVIGHVLAQGVSTWTKAGVIPPDAGLRMKARVCVPIRWRGDLLGLLMVMDADGSLTTGELAVITQTAHEVAPLILPAVRGDADATADERTLLDLLAPAPLLRRRALADLAAQSATAAFGAVTVVELAAEGVAEGPVAAHADMALRAALTSRSLPGPRPRWHAVAQATAVVLLGGGARAYADQLVRRVDDLSAGRFTCVAGIGGTVAGLDLAHESAEQARLARQAAAGVLAHRWSTCPATPSSPAATSTTANRRSPVVAWDELGPYGLLLRIPAEQRGARALPDELRRLLAADPDRHLTGTVAAFLDHAGNGPAAAAAMHIHRTTLYYRLSRVRELTGLDLDDGRTRLTLHMGLAMLALGPGPDIA